MGLLGELLDIGSEVGTLGLEGAEKIGAGIGEATPLVGTAINAGKGIYHASLAHDAEMAHDQDGADHYGSEAAYDWMKAVPVLGTALGAGEMASGLYWGANAAYHGRGFGDVVHAGVAGMDNFKDTTKDIGSMAGISEFGGSKYGHLGAHGELRETIEGRDPLLAARVAQAQAGKR